MLVIISRFLYTQQLIIVFKKRNKELKRNETSHSHITKKQQMYRQEHLLNIQKRVITHVKYICE